MSAEFRLRPLGSVCSDTPSRRRISAIVCPVDTCTKAQTSCSFARCFFFTRTFISARGHVVRDHSQPDLAQESGGRPQFMNGPGAASDGIHTDAPERPEPRVAESCIPRFSVQASSVYAGASLGPRAVAMPSARCRGRPSPRCRQAPDPPCRLTDTSRGSKIAQGT